MARVSAGARAGKFRWSRAGYRALQSSAGVQLVLARKARAVAAAANAALSADGYDAAGYEVRPFEGKMARGAVVRTKTDHARADNARHNTLLKSLGAAR